MKYPIILAHGLADNTGWGRIPDALRRQGAAVYLGGQDAYGSIEFCAGQLARVVDTALREQDCAKVNIIAHSKGGLEARYMISSMGFGEKIASLTMLSTPHRGANPAKKMCTWPGFSLWSRRNDTYRAKHGDAAPDSLQAIRQLTPAYLEQFNPQNPDVEGVYYQSWGAQLGSSRSDPYMILTGKIFYPSNMANDGLVTPDSSKWGEYRGTLDGVSHQELVDTFQRDTKFFCPVAFIQQIVQELGQMGF